MNLTHRHRQRGAVIITVCLMLLFLLGFMGFALDFGRLFIVKTELQTAMDSCALSAAHELDQMPDSITRAGVAGETASNNNRVNMQSDSWAGQAKLDAANITYRNATFQATTDPLLAKYAECSHTQPSVQMYLLHILGAVSGNTTAAPDARSVAASAVATRGSTQTTCPIPVALKPKTTGCAGGNCGAPNYGFAPGEWVTLIMAQNAAVGGEIGWANLDGSNNAAETSRELLGSCGTRIGDKLGTPGVQTSVADVWNFRFGIYKATGNPALNRPDMTGYSYTAKNWPAQFNAYRGPAPAATPDTATSQNFVTKRTSNASCADQNPATNNQGITACETIIGRTLNSFQKLAAPGAANGGHREYGLSRRIVLVPVINGTLNVIDYACMLMLQPLSIPMGNVQMEFIGNAAGSSGNPSPCTTSGLPGGSAGPMVPVLVR